MDTMIDLDEAKIAGYFETIKSAYYLKLMFLTAHSTDEKKIILPVDAGVDATMRKTSTETTTYSRKHWIVAIQRSFKTTTRTF